MGRRGVVVGLVIGILAIGMVAWMVGMYDPRDTWEGAKDAGRSAVDAIDDLVYESEISESAGRVAEDVQRGVGDVATDVGDAVSDRAPTAVFPIRTESGFEAELVERHVYELTNEERTKHGLAPLDRIGAIDVIAREHSRDMSARDYFEHDNPEGLDPTDRGNAAGYECRKDQGTYYTYGLAENITLHYTYSSYAFKGVPTSYTWLGSEMILAKEMVDGWMDSTGHRENILNPDYDRIGVGVAISPDEEAYATQNFC